MNAVHIDATTIGTGSSIVLSHGLGDDSHTWDELVPLLTPFGKVTTWDLRGHGASDRGDDLDYSRESAVGDLAGIVARADPPVHLVGHSLGGYLSLTLALREPDVVASLTLVASGPGYRNPQAREAWNQYVDGSVEKMPIPAAAGQLGKQDDSWVIDHLTELQPHLLLIVGERDERFHAGMDFLAKAVPGSTTVRVEGAGHHPQRSHPEIVAEAIRAHTSSSAAPHRCET